MSRSRRTPLLAAALAVTTGLALFAVADGANARDEADTIKLVATITGYHTNKGEPGRAGDVDTFKDALRTPGGKKVGVDYCLCAAADSHNLICDAVLRFDDGILTATFPFDETKGRGTGAITGGTGTYSGAKGSITEVARKDTDPQKYDYTIHLEGTSGPIPFATG